MTLQQDIWTMVYYRAVDAIASQADANLERFPELRPFIDAAQELGLTPSQVFMLCCFAIARPGEMN